MNHFRIGMNQDTVQAMNRRLLLFLLREQNLCSRAKLSQLSGLKQATVTNIINDFISWHLVKETGTLEGKKGRRSIGITINTDRYLVASIRLARKYAIIALFDLNGKIIFKKNIETQSINSPIKVIDIIIKKLKEIIKIYKDKVILGLGIAIPGPFSTQEERIALMTENESWKNIAIKEVFENSLDIPIFFEHDANAGALAQLWYMQPTLIDRFPEILIYVAAGQGVGAGVLIDGKILKGSIGTAGEIGHTSINFNGPLCSCGNNGCLEKYSSSIAYLRKINEKSSNTIVADLDHAKKLIIEGDFISLQEYKKSVEYLGIGIINLVYSFNPEVIIVGDEMAKFLPDIMLDTLRKTLKKHVIPEIYNNLTISLSLTSEDEILCGGAIVVINQIFNSPLDFISEYI